MPGRGLGGLVRGRRVVTGERCRPSLLFGIRNTAMSDPLATLPQHTTAHPPLIDLQ